MLILITSRINEADLQKVSEDFDGYIKVVVDIEKGILVAGGKRHVDGEKMLLDGGSRQSDLWGGGLDLQTNEIDYDSMINIRPNDNNPGREVLSLDIRKNLDKIIRKLLRWVPKI